MGRAWQALAAYLALALVATWPLARRLGGDVPADLGDPLFAMWAISWDSEQLLAILRGDLARIPSFFDANIFHPAPLTLAYSEHYIAQAVQALPLYAATHNPILSYNLLFLATFALSGLGMYLLVRSLTGHPLAAFAAGALFAFAPYRFAQSSHLEVLSSQWMPFALYGVRRYFDALQPAGSATSIFKRWLPLAGTVAALVAQNLSSAYYLLYLTPFAVAYVVWETVQRGAWRNRTAVIELAIALFLAAAATAPFLAPYARLRDQLQPERSRAEVVRSSADIYSYVTARAEQPIWGTRLRVFPKPDGELFPGALPLLLAAIGLTVWPRTSTVRMPMARRVLAACLVAAIAAHVALVGAALSFRRVSIDVGLFDLRASNVNQLLLRIVVLIVILLFLSPAVRSLAGDFFRARGFFLLVLIAALWLSLGPAPQALGRPLEFTGIYNVLYERVPGFDLLRAPARFGMLAVLVLSVLAGYGVATLASLHAARVSLGVIAIAFLSESVLVPFAVNQTTIVQGFNPPEPRVYRPQRAPAAYAAFAREAAPAVLAELPFGQVAFDQRAVFYSIAHRHRLLNGYSGYVPPHYGQLSLALADVPRQPDLAWDALRAAGATHVLVHEGAWLDDEGANTSATLRKRGAAELFRDGRDVLLKLP